MENLAYSDPPVTELIEGKVCLMSPRPCVDHNLVSSRIYRIFADYLEGKTCMALSDGYDVFLDEENHYVPDGMIVCDRSKIRPKGIYGAPDLVVEVLSPSTMMHDRGPKMRHYAAAGVKEYWIVSPEMKSVEVYYNQDGRFEIVATYVDYRQEDIDDMTDEERATVVWEIPVSLYDDLRIRVKDIFLDLDTIQ
ncbi:MAG: Uma2 family endonuclease [Selenomonas sp.]|nr:Uma2 family endonuclease [Veillonellaceae bacterium]MDY6350671.1 Uma2 family endonuclease [Selenomonas sp.]